MSTLDEKLECFYKAAKFLETVESLAAKQVGMNIFGEPDEGEDDPYMILQQMSVEIEPHLDKEIRQVFGKKRGKKQ